MSRPTPASYAPPPRLHRQPLLYLAVVSLALAWTWMAHISARDPWFRNTDMNIHNIADALAINSGYTPGTVDQPGAPTKFLLALDFRLRNEAGALPTWHLKRFARSPDMLQEFTRLVQASREHCRVLVMLFILLAAAFVGQVTRRFDAACLSVMLLSSSSGLLFHGLLLRPELLCAGLGGVVAMHAAWLASAARQPGSRSLWLLLAGLCVGLALLSKLPALLYLLLICLWLALAPLLPALDADAPPTSRPSLRWTVIAALVAAAATFGLLLLLRTRPDLINPVALQRLRLIATVCALLPLISLGGATGRLPRYLTDRVLDLSLLIAGLLVACVGWFGLLQTTMPTAHAADYIAKILNTAIYPDPLLPLFTHPGEAHRLRQAMRFFMEAPVLWVTTTLFAAALVFLRGAHARWRAFALLQFLQAVGMVALMSKRQYFNQYGVFVEVPLLLTWAFGLATVHSWWRLRPAARQQSWPMAVTSTAAFILGLGVPLQLGPIYNRHQDDSAVPVRELTVTFLYDHDAHPPAFLAAMKARYPTRRDFTDALNQFLSDPSNRR